MLSLEDISFEMLDDMSGDGLVTLRITTPLGSLLVMGEPVTTGREMIARGVHLHGEGFGANALGPVVLRSVADALLRELDLVELVVEGAIRTTGANPGSRPRPVRFARRSLPEGQPRPG